MTPHDDGKVVRLFGRAQSYLVERSLIVNAKSARALFGAALALYILWFVALVTLAVVSGERPVSRTTNPATAPASSPSVLEQTSG